MWVAAIKEKHVEWYERHALPIACKHPQLRYAAQHSGPTAQGTEPAVGTDTGFLEEEPVRFMTSGPYGHSVPAGLVSHHTASSWAV